MRKFILVSLLFLIGCEATPKINPDFSANWQGDVTQPYAWRYWTEKTIKQQFAKNGFVETNNDPDVVAYGFIGTWTDKEDYYWTEKRPLKWSIDSIQVAPEGAVFNKFKFPNRKIAWYFCWSSLQSEDAASAAIQQAQKIYFEKIHKKN